MWVLTVASATYRRADLGVGPAAGQPQDLAFPGGQLGDGRRARSSGPPAGRVP